MKKMLALLLALCLCMAFALPTMAQTAPADMEAALTNVTSIVKDTLMLGDDYTEFSGDYYEDIALNWNLSWSDDTRRLSVTCDESGKIIDLYASTNTETTDLFYGFDPVFPALSAADARIQAEEWLVRLVGEGESARIDRESSSIGANSSHRFSGRILLNGLESPITFTLRMDENGLRSYSRSDGYSPYVGELPPPEAAAGQLTAAVQLAGAVDMELYYVMDDAAGEARLRYVPVGPYTVVDAATGDVVDMDALYEEIGSTGYALTEASAAEAPAAADTAGGDRNNLSLMELNAIGNYGAVLTEEEIDAMLRVNGALGLTADYELSRLSYAMDGKTGDVTASVRYAATMTKDELYGFSKDQFEEMETWGDSLTIWKYITVNAKTGALMDVSTDYPLWKEAEDHDPAEHKKAAEDFLKLCVPDMYGDTRLCDLADFERDDRLTYTRVENGYFYPENYITIRMNPSTATVDEFHTLWDEDVTFASARGILSASDGAAAYVDALDVTLGYVAWPEEIREDDIELLRYLEWGYTWVESLRLGYYFSGIDEIAGVDALTGDIIGDRDSAEGAYTYGDIAAVEEKEAIEALGAAGIGFAGGKFQPASILSQKEALCLLLQAAGYDPTGWDEEQIRSEAVYQGFITADQWQPGVSVSRMAFMKMLLGASRYGDAAELTGVWSCDFTDVSATDMGYAALAQGLGLASGTEFDPLTPCTRAMAAEFLFAFMSR